MLTSDSILLPFSIPYMINQDLHLFPACWFFNRENNPSFNHSIKVRRSKHNITIIHTFTTTYE